MFELPKTDIEMYLETISKSKILKARTLQLLKATCFVIMCMCIYIIMYKYTPDMYGYMYSCLYTMF